MILLPKSCFLHVPKTGGSWARTALKAAVGGWQEYAPGGDVHRPYAEAPSPRPFRFAFVRHPLELYRSYWRFKRGVGWDPDNEVDRVCEADDFETFVRRVVERFPGHYTAALESFVGPPESPIEFIGRYENLVDDLVDALTRAGERFDEAAIRSLPPRNVSDRAAFRTELSPATEAAVRAAERGAFERFGYD